MHHNHTIQYHNQNSIVCHSTVIFLFLLYKPAATTLYIHVHYTFSPINTNVKGPNVYIYTQFFFLKYNILLRTITYDVIWYTQYAPQCIYDAIQLRTMTYYEFKHNISKIYQK